MRFDDRTHAGHLLALALAAQAPPTPCTVLGLPRGGVPVAAPIARRLGAPLDVLVVRKLGFPGREEFAMGALASGGVRVMSEAAKVFEPPTEAELQAAIRRETAELQRREALYRAGRPPLVLTGRCALLVDDGLATGATMRAAVRAARHCGAREVRVAVPVASREAMALLRTEADDVFSLQVPEDFYAVGAWYRDFDQTTDEEVLRLLSGSA